MGIETDILVIANVAGAILVFWGAYLNYRVSRMDSDSAEAFKQGLKEGRNIAEEVTAAVERVHAGSEGIQRQQRELISVIKETLGDTLQVLRDFRGDLANTHTQLLEIIREKL